MPTRKARNVSLMPELKLCIDGTIASGRCGSASEVVRAALRLIKKDERGRQTAMAARAATSLP